MIAIGIDIGKGKHAVAVIDEVGRPLCKSAFYDNNRAGAEKLLAALRVVAPPSGGTRIGMEATGGYWFALHDFLVKAGYRVDVINPIVTSASISGDVRGRKTDKGDALAIARVVLRGGDQTPAEFGQGFPTSHGSHAAAFVHGRAAFGHETARSEPS